MRYTYHVDTTSNILYGKATGVVTDDAFVRSFALPEHVPHYRLGMPILSDYTEGVMRQVSTEAIRMAADVVQRSGRQCGHMKWAIVFASDVGYGLGRMLSSLTSDGPIEIRVFRTVTSAREWLIHAA